MWNSFVGKMTQMGDPGPSWPSCYEDLNGDLRSLFHGTTNVELQISSAVVIHQQLPLLVMSIPRGSEMNILYQRLKNLHKCSNRKYIGNSSLVVGTQLIVSFCQTQDSRFNICLDQFTLLTNFSGCSVMV